MLAVVVAEKGLEQALLSIAQANKEADAIELRLDFLEEANEHIVEELIEACEKPVIATFRKLNFGASVEDTERLFLLKKAVDFGAYFIDVDYDTDLEFISDLRSIKANAAVILSHHNFDETPPLPELLQKLSEMAEVKGADVFKIVCRAIVEQDNDTMLALLHSAKTHGLKIIAFCMGEKGLKSRIESIKLGGFMGYASLSAGKESAPGQLSVSEMRKALGEKNG